MAPDYVACAYAYNFDTTSVFSSSMQKRGHMTKGWEF